MTAAERQQPHRDIVTRVPLTKSVREDLQRLISNREKVMNRRRCNARPNCSPSSSSGWPPIYKSGSGRERRQCNRGVGGNC